MVSSVMPHCFIRANGRDLGPGSNANRETRSSKSCLIIKAMPALFTIFPLLLVNPNSAFTNAPTPPRHGHPWMLPNPGQNLGSAACEPQQLEDADSEGSARDSRHPPSLPTASAWQHQGIYSLRHDCIRPSMTANKMELHPTALKSSNSELLQRLDLFE